MLSSIHRRFTFLVVNNIIINTTGIYFQPHYLVKRETGDATNDAISRASRNSFLPKIVTPYIHGEDRLSDINQTTQICPSQFFFRF